MRFPQGAALEKLHPNYVDMYYAETCWMIMIKTSDPRYKLHEYMNGDDVEWPNLSLFGWETKLIWVYLIVILFSPFRHVSLLFYLFEIIYVKQFDLMDRA
jgi:hypothetical protein